MYGLEGIGTHESEGSGGKKHSNSHLYGSICPFCTKMSIISDIMKREVILYKTK